MRLILATLAAVGLLAIGMAVGIASGVLRLPQLDSFPVARLTTHPTALDGRDGAATRPAADAPDPAELADPPDPVLPDPSALDRAIVLAADAAKLSGPRVRLYSFDGGDGAEERRDHERGMGRQRVQVRRLEGRREEGPPPPVIRAWSQPQDVAEWTFAVPQAGKYAVTLVYTTGGSGRRSEGGGGGPFELTVGEEKISGRAESTGRGYRMIEVGRVNLAKGEATLRLRPAEELDAPLMTLRSVKLYPLGQ